MKKINTYIQEKLIVNNTIQNNTYIFKEDNILKDMEVEFPIIFYIPDLKKSIKVMEIDHDIDFFNQDLYIFYLDKDKKDIFIKLAPEGIKNIFFKNKFEKDSERQGTPKIYKISSTVNINSRYYLYVDNIDECIINKPKNI